MASPLPPVMAAEVAERAGAGWYDGHPDRAAYRNGYREREWDTRVGTIELAIPRLRTCPNGPPAVLTHTDCGHTLEPVTACAHCGDPVDNGSVESIPDRARPDQRPEAAARRRAESCRSDAPRNPRVSSSASRSCPPVMFCRKCPSPGDTVTRVRRRSGGARRRSAPRAPSSRCRRRPRRRRPGCAPAG